MTDFTKEWVEKKQRKLAAKGIKQPGLEKEKPAPKRRTLQKIIVHKYNAQPTVYNGKKYPSKGEALRAEWWSHNEDVYFYQEQPRIELGLRENVYIPDFEVFFYDGRVIFEDVKGMETPKFKRDKKLWERHGKFPLWITKRKGNEWITEVVKPEGV